MLKPAPLPPVFDRYRATGGILECATFEGSDGSVEDLKEAIAACIPPPCAADTAMLWDYGGKEIGPAEFLGAWRNPASGRLIRVGKWYGLDGTRHSGNRAVAGLSELRADLREPDKPGPDHAALLKRASGPGVA